jgi:hypothetical protein
MNKKIIAELQKYLDGLKNNAPAGEYARAMQAFQALTTALETIDPTDKTIEAARQAAGLGDAPLPASGDVMAQAARRAAGLPG